MKLVWDQHLIDDWNWDLNDMLIKAGGVGKLYKGYCHLYKSIKVGSMSLYLGTKHPWRGCFIVKGIARYAQVYNVDTNIYGKSSIVLCMKRKVGMPDCPFFQFGAKITHTTAKCSNIMGRRYFVLYILFCIFCFVYFVL